MTSHSKQSAGSGGETPQARGRRARRSGVQAERDVVKFWEDNGFQANRKRLVGGMEGNKWGEDVLVHIPVLGTISLEVKLRQKGQDGGKRYQQWLEGVDCLFVRAKGDTQWYAYMKADFLVEILKVQETQRKEILRLNGLLSKSVTEEMYS
tara:strand:- start:752 stop:1204 length:453 start_codon:yes stop_codon:yes gene_type:complete